MHDSCDTGAAHHCHQQNLKCIGLTQWVHLTKQPAQQYLCQQ
jgi:hypothetical protein